MKKQLLSTSAIALGVAMAAPASAQQWDLEWGGFVNTHIGASDVDLPSGDDRDFDGVNVYTNSEIIFRPSVTLDNGLTFGAVVEFEALNQRSSVVEMGGDEAAVGGTSDIDESFAYMESDTLGRIEAGSHNSAGYLLSKGAPTVGSMAINSPSISAFVPYAGTQGSAFRTSALSSYTEVAGNNDVQRITYFTPSFNGLVAGVSYAPSGSGNATNNAPVDFNSDPVTDIFDIGVAYDQSFGGVDLGLSARWGTGNSNVSAIDDPTTWSIGAQLGFNAFTFGGSYGENDNGAAGGVGDTEGFSLGVSYDIAGPWSVGLETYQGEIKGGAAPNSDYETYKLAASRSLGAGVSWDVYYAYVETNNGFAAGNPKIEGNVLATAINLSF